MASARTDLECNEAAPLLQKDQPSMMGRVILGIPAWAICLTWIAFGVAMACWMEEWGPDTAVYVILQIITTIGYGDVTVHTERMKFYTTFYVFLTLLLLAAYVTELGNAVTKGATNMLSKHLVRIKKQKEQEEQGAVASDDADPSQAAKDHDQAVASILVFAFFAIVGTVFFGIVEACSCSYGVTAIDGCEELPVERCYETGGAVKTWVDSFYMAVITMTTVGFGDHSPKSRSGRAFGCVWMVLGVVATANMMGQFGTFLLVQKERRRQDLRLSRKLFQHFDQTHDGQLTRNEFRYYAILKFGLATKADFDEIDAIFDSIDADQTGSLSFEEIERHCDL